MADYASKQDSEAQEDDIVETLLRLPTKNLESRIKQFESEVKERQQFRNNALSTLGTHKLRLEDQLQRLRYFLSPGQGLQINQGFLTEIIRLEGNIIDEVIACFRDVSRLREKLQEAREELEASRQKLKLIESED